MNLLLLALFAIHPRIDSICESVDIVEVNHIYGANGDHIVDNIIWWEKGHIKATRYAGGYVQVSDSTYRWTDDLKRVPFWDGTSWLSCLDDHGTHRRIYARTFHESWTQGNVAKDDAYRGYFRKGFRAK